MWIGFFFLACCCCCKSNCCCRCISCCFCNCSCCCNCICCCNCCSCEGLRVFGCTTTVGWLPWFSTNCLFCGIWAVAKTLCGIFCTTSWGPTTRPSPTGWIWLPTFESNDNREFTAGVILVLGILFRGARFFGARGALFWVPVPAWIEILGCGSCSDELGATIVGTYVEKQLFKRKIKSNNSNEKSWCLQVKMWIYTKKYVSRNLTY